MMLCDAKAWMGIGHAQIRGLAVRRILVERLGGRWYAALRIGVRGYFPLRDLDNFREGDEHPSASALLGPLPEQEERDG